MVVMVMCQLLCNGGILVGYWWDIGGNSIGCKLFECASTRPRHPRDPPPTLVERAQISCS